MEITEKQYLEAVHTVIKYTEQVNKKSVKVLTDSGIAKTPKQLYYDWDNFFPNMQKRLWNILYHYFKDKRICDITKEEFLSVRNAGMKSWTELCELTGNN
jgi:hypothetical protein